MTSVITYGKLWLTRDRGEMTTIDKHKFARAVKRYREEKDLTQKELAEKLMTTTTTVARWALGMSVPKQDRIIREIKALGINW